MVALNTPAVPSRPMWLSRLVRFGSATASALLLAAWAYMLSRTHPAWPAVALSGLATFLAASSYAFNVRPQPGRLLLFGKDKVQVRSLDEWTLYQYGLTFEGASPEQQNEALNPYQVGLRLFPARPQDRPVKQGSLQWLLSVLSYCAFLTLLEAVHGWERFLLLAALYGWMLMCLRLSKRFSESPSSDLTALRLS